ncbi:uncharacterized protein LOC126577350 [Anopheles aquasalis]|uniref:uncharacterized protein LOC126577350 n=1 Tax=Anopheles aquasalis TaxID=42839 RepID=UPI00215A1ACC|nr:uncharacterized protein LOC126577350 [Anopheles aquasalis]
MQPVVAALFAIVTMSSYQRLVTGETTFEQYVEVMFQTDAVFENLCLRKTNDSSEAQRMVAANIELQNCVNQYHDPQNFTNSLDELTIEKRKQFIDYNCAEFEEIKKCYIPFERQMKLCLSERDQSMAKTLIVLEKEFEFICENEGANVVPMERSNYSFCAGNLNVLLQECSETKWQQLRKKTISTMTAQDCSTFEELSNCFQDNIKKCGAPLFAQLFAIRYRDIVRQTPCSVLAAVPSVD